MSGLLPFLLQQAYATRTLDVVKMRDRVPCEVDDEINQYRCTIQEIVFDPLRVEEVNAVFEARGFMIPEGMQVIAVNSDSSILLWGGNELHFPSPPR